MVLEAKLDDLTGALISAFLSLLDSSVLWSGPHHPRRRARKRSRRGLEDALASRHSRRHCLMYIP